MLRVSIGKCMAGCMVVTVLGVRAPAATSEQLTDAFETILDATLDTQATRAVSNVVLEHKDLVLSLDSGRVGFFSPITIDSTNRYFGAYFEGRGRLRYAPPVRIEREQMKRFFDTDSLDGELHEVYLLFSQAEADYLTGTTQPSPEPFGKDQVKRVKAFHKELTKDENYYYVFKTLRNQLVSSTEPFLFVCAEPDKSDRLSYMYDPLRREEISLSKDYWRPGIRFMELICSYSRLVDESYALINGEAGPELTVTHYDIDATIDRSGQYSGHTRANLTIRKPTQLLEFGLHEELQVDSVVDADGTQVAFRRWQKDSNKSEPLYLFLNKPLSAGEETRLDFHYHGDVCEREMGEFFVTAQSRWYPRYPFESGATFDMTFQTPREFAFVATGERQSSDTLKDTVVSVWSVTEPAYNVSFTIGNLAHFEYDDDIAGQIDLYYNKALHTNRNRQKQVSEDVIGATRLFTHYFGENPYRTTTVSEILTMHGEAFPGFIHLGYPFWETDNWGYSRIDRSHEVAHQWWGVGVGTATYHDRWLSEGFAEYCGLMYYQAVAGGDKFLAKLEEYRDEIFSVRDYIFGSGAESGPIILGYRTSSTETQGDFGLIIYKKGAWVLHMLRNMLLDLRSMNEETFYGMLHDFYQINLGRRVATADFQRFVESYAGIEMDWFFKQWVYGNDLPTYEFRYDCEEDGAGGFVCNCHVTTKNVGKDWKMFLPIEIEFGGKSKAYTRVLVDQPDLDFPIAGLPQMPKKLRLNPFESVLARVKQ